MVSLTELEITTIPFMVKGEEGREKGKTATPNNDRVGFTLTLALFFLLRRQRTEDRLKPVLPFSLPPSLFPFTGITFPVIFYQYS
jgi:hypothetical protein